MQNDILPPANWRDTKKTKSKSLSGFSLDKTRGRFVRDDAQKAEAAAANAYAKTPPKHVKDHWGRKKRLAVFLSSFIVLAGVIGATYFLFFHHKTPVPVQQTVVKAQPAPAPKTVASPLTGLQVDPALAARPVTAVMVENSLDARPQSGLQDAGVVFEAIAEAGITRFMGLFQEANPQYVGPVRSLRPYYIDFAAPFAASIAHVGGSPDALSQVRNGPYRDLDQFFNSAYYWRSSGRVAPHNVYTSFERLDGLNKSKGYNSSQFTPWPRKPDKPLSAPTATHVDVSLSGPLYNSHYDYDAKTNSYKRSEGGQPHLEETDASGRNTVQLNPRVIVTLSMGYGVLPDGYHSVYNMTGSGQMYVFQDGGAVSGVWSKSDRGSPFQFKDEAGKPLPLNAGMVWVVAVTGPGSVSFGL